MQLSSANVFAANRINLVVAHSAEAKPLRAMFNLRTQLLSRPFPVYQNAEGISLIVSGIGKTSAAAATAYLAGLQASLPACAWLNIGIAGHQHAAIGTGLLAHKIIDAANGDSFYPPQLLQGLQTATVITVAVPEKNYPQDAAYDMEAAGFYACASRIVTTELAQVFKIVSDNPRHTLTSFDIAQVQGLIEGQQSALTRLLGDLDALLASYRKAYTVSPVFEFLLTSYRFTATRRVQLQRLCERFHALGLDPALFKISDQQFSTSKQLLLQLELELAAQVGS